jgi:hypothetical protein
MNDSETQVEDDIDDDTNDTQDPESNDLVQQVLGKSEVRIVDMYAN